MGTIGRVAVLLIALTAAGMVLRNSGGTAQVINAVTGGYGSLLNSARGGS